MTTPENESETGKYLRWYHQQQHAIATLQNHKISNFLFQSLPEPSGTFSSFLLNAIFTSRNVRAKPARTFASRSLSKPSLPEPFGEPDVSPRSAQLPAPSGPLLHQNMRRDLLGIFLIANVFAVYVSHAACLALISSCHFKEHRDQVHYTNCVPTVRLGLRDAHLVSTHMELHYFTGNFPTILPVHYAQELLPNSP